MIIKEIDNITYQINLPNSNINIYNKDSLERITKKIFKKITNKKKLNPLLILDIYENNMYGTIITLKHYKSMFNIDNEYEVKIHVHTNPTFLYKIDYFTINNHSNSSIYYYKNNYIGFFDGYIGLNYYFIIEVFIRYVDSSCIN